MAADGVEEAGDMVAAGEEAVGAMGATVVAGGIQVGAAMAADGGIQAGATAVGGVTAATAWEWAAWH